MTRGRVRLVIEVDPRLMAAIHACSKETDKPKREIVIRAICKRLGLKADDYLG